MKFGFVTYKKHLFCSFLEKARPIRNWAFVLLLLLLTYLLLLTMWNIEVLCTSLIYKKCLVYYTVCGNANISVSATSCDVLYILVYILVHCEYCFFCYTWTSPGIWLVYTYWLYSYLSVYSLTVHHVCHCSKVENNDIRENLYWQIIQNLNYIERSAAWNFVYDHFHNCSAEICLQCWRSFVNVSEFPHSCRGCWAYNVHFFLLC